MARVNTNTIFNFMFSGSLTTKEKSRVKGLELQTSTHMFLLLKILSLTPSGLASLSQVADLALVDTAHENSAHLGLALAQLTHFIFYVQQSMGAAPFTQLETM